MVSVSGYESVSVFLVWGVVEVLKVHQVEVLFRGSVILVSFVVVVRRSKYWKWLVMESLEFSIATLYGALYMVPVALMIRL